MALELKTKPQLAKDASTMAHSFELVRYREVTYVPADFETRDFTTPPAEDRKIWLPMDKTFLRRFAAAQFNTLFANDSELNSFNFMVAQSSRHVDEVATSLLVRTPEGLRELSGEGQFTEPTGEFVPNTLVPMLNEDLKAKDEVFSVIAEWLDSEEEAHSLLHHLATALAPGWSAVKYVLLLGEGRNGKGLLMRMLHDVVGKMNTSHVTRLDMAEKTPAVIDLNGKLLNIVFDGQAAYLKDSGTEKTLIAGEIAAIKKLYESSPVLVQTNALFIEGLNREPKSNDKSSALQKRLVRFQFSNVYALDRKFERHMLHEERLGAFLSLLIDHYVHEDDLAEKLAPTAKAIELQLEHMYVNSLALQFFKQYEENDPIGVKSFLGEPITNIVKPFQSWRIKENDLSTWSEPDVLALFGPMLNTERRSVRIGGVPRKVRVTTSLKPEARAFIEALKETEDGDTAAVGVADGSTALVED